MTTPPPSEGYQLSQSSWDDAELAALQRVIDSGQFTMAGETAAYESDFADYLGSAHCVAVNSGSTANLLMVAALFHRQQRPLRRGDEVIVPAVSWPTTYYPLDQYGLHLKFVDIDARTLNYDLAALEAAITDRTRLLMVVNLLGNPNEFEKIRDLCAARGIEFIEDNCESLGATYGGRQCGTHGLMGSFSGFFSHHISTMEGGVVCTDDEELYHLLLCLRAHGWTRDLPKHNLVTGVKGDDPFLESYNFVLPGYSVRPLEMSAAVGQEQLRKLDRFVRERRANAEAYKAMMTRFPDLMVQEELGSSSWFGFSMVVRPGAPFARSDLVRAFRGAGIECRPVVAGNFTKNPVMQRMDHEVFGALPNADLIDTSGLFVGNREGDLSRELGLLEGVLERVAWPAP